MYVCMYVMMYVQCTYGSEWQGAAFTPPLIWLATRCSVPTLYQTNESGAFVILPIQLRLFRPAAIQRTPCWVIDLAQSIFSRAAVDCRSLLELQITYYRSIFGAVQ